MNINGVARSYMAKNKSEEEFLLHVANVVEQQLKEWDDHFEVMVMKLKNYEIVIKNSDDYFHLHLSEKEIEELQKSGPYQLDRKLWTDLEKQGLPILKGFGNYIESIFL